MPGKGGRSSFPGRAVAEPLKRVRVAALDVEHARRWTTVLVGPLELPSRAELLDRYTALAEHGNPARLSLQPALESRRWRQIPVQAARVIHAADAPPPGSPLTALLPQVRALRDRDIDGGLRILCAGDQLAIDFCHGLGEVAFVHLILDVLLGAVDPADPDLLAAYRSRRSPVLRAALRTFGTSPHRVASVVKEYRDRATLQATAHRVDQADAAPVRPFRPAPTTRVVGLPAAAVAEIRRQRDVHLPGVSLVALCTYALWEAFADTGPGVDDTVKIPFDVRRYLGAAPSTLGPFTAGLDYTLGAGGLARLQAEMDRSARSGRPVANLLMGTLKARLHRQDAEDLHPARPRMRLLHSNVGWPPNSGRWPLTDPASAYMLVASDPAGPEGITVTSAAMSGNLWLTAEFHGNVFDPERIDAALNTVGDRMYTMASGRFDRRTQLLGCPGAQ
ncbi:hypothetical protein [[Mycobacterium] wendilense]|uniref:Condensation domain-containing protein n=1 Tax=[Mycobacterium] wendilense TaxID=3064284 RepID=A0ABN9NZF8_9MYCO|nr:hypothetical protein [Mycolicibacterium sp. MU0050]CAJ1583342.1 hypothetical protein MU0050_002564 [Mycolicibacterium sp. MU0050]